MIGSQLFMALEIEIETKRDQTSPFPLPLYHHLFTQIQGRRRSVEDTGVWPHGVIALTIDGLLPTAGGVGRQLRAVYHVEQRDEVRLTFPPNHS